MRSNGRICSFITAAVLSLGIIAAPAGDAFAGIRASAAEPLVWEEESTGVYTVEGEKSSSSVSKEGAAPDVFIIPISKLLPEGKTTENIRSLKVEIQAKKAVGSVGYQSTSGWKVKDWSNYSNFVIDDAENYSEMYFNVYTIGFNTDLKVTFTVTCKDGSMTKHDDPSKKAAAFSTWQEVETGVYTCTTRSATFRDDRDQGAEKPPRISIPVKKLLPKGKTVKDVESLSVEMRSLNGKAFNGAVGYHIGDEYKYKSGEARCTFTIDDDDDWQNIGFEPWWLDFDDTVAVKFTVKCKDGTVSPENKTDPNTVTLWSGKKSISWTDNGSVTVPAEKFGSVTSGDTLIFTYNETNTWLNLRIVNPMNWVSFEGIKEKDEDDNALPLFSPYSFKITEKDAAALKENGLLVAGQQFELTKIELISSNPQAAAVSEKDEGSKTADSYIYCYNSDMKLIKKITVKEGTSGKERLQIDLGKKYAKKKVTLYSGKKSTSTKLGSAKLNSKGKATFKNSKKKEYTLVIED